MSRTILITGGCGFIGRNLVKYIKQYTDDFVMVVDNLSSESSNLDDCDADYIDVSDITTIVDKYQDDNISVIFHLAGYARIQPSFGEPLKAIHSNTYGTSCVGG